MQQWEFVEAVLPPYRTHKEKGRLGRQVRNITWILLSVALGMDFFSFVIKIISYLSYCYSGAFIEYGIHNDASDQC